MVPRRASLCRLCAPFALSVLAACPVPTPSESTDTSPASTTGGAESTGATGATSSGETSGPTGATTVEGTSVPSTGTSAGETTSEASTGALSETTSEASTGALSGTTSEASTGALPETTSGSSGPAPDTCGDGVLDPGELCDDGDLLAGDDCLPDCTPGTGAALPPIALPQGQGLHFCLTTIDGALLGSPSHAFVLGGLLPFLIPPAQVQRFTLGILKPPMWSFVHDGPFKRSADQVATAANGDIIVAGHIDTDARQTAGHLWLARLSPAGEVVWIHEHAELPTAPLDLALTPADEIVLASRRAGWSPGFKPSWVQRFDAGGNLQWEHAGANSPEWGVRYQGVTIAADGTIYAAGYGRPEGASFSHLVLASLTSDGTPQWEIEAPSPFHLRAEPSGIVLTNQGSLIVALTESDAMFDFGLEPGLAAFDTDGAPLWWNSWPPPPNWNVWAGPIVAAPGGGALVAWGESQEDTARTRVTRFNEDGDELWQIQSDSEATPHDATLGPDGVFYVLEGTASEWEPSSLRPYLP